MARAMNVDKRLIALQMICRRAKQNAARAARIANELRESSLRGAHAKRAAKIADRAAKLVQSLEQVTF